MTQSPIAGRVVRPRVRRRQGRRRATTPSTSRCSATASIYHDGWRAVCPVPGPSFAEAGIGFGEMEITEEKLRELDAKGWELYHVDEDFSETRNVADEHRDKLIEMIALWYVGGGQVQRAADRQPRHRAPRRRAPAARAAARTSTSTTRGRRWSRTRSRRASSTARTASPRRWRSRTAPRACWWRRGARRAATRSTSRTTSSTTPTTTSASSISTIATDATIDDGRHELRFEFEPTGKPDLAHGKGTPARGQLYIDGKLAGQGDLPVTIPLDIGITDGLTCGRDDGSTVTADYPSPFAFTGTLEKVVVDVSGELIEDKSAEMRSVMAHQ